MGVGRVAGCKAARRDEVRWKEIECMAGRKGACCGESQNGAGCC